MSRDETHFRPEASGDAAGRGRPWAAAAGLVAAGCTAVAAASAWERGSAVAAHGGGVRGDATAWPFLLLLAAAFVAYLGGLAALRAARGRRTVALVVAVAAAVQLAPLGAPLLLSTDAWTYWGYGWAAHTGGNPYVDPPSRFPDSPAAPWLGGAWRETTSAYGPLFTLAGEPIAAVAGSSPDAAAWIYKAIAAVCALGCAVGAGRLTRRRALAVAFVGWNPVLAMHLAGGGHNDAWVAALLVAALALAHGRRLDAAGAAWSLAILVKWVPLVFLALRAVEARATGRATRHAGFAAAAAAVLALATWRYGVDWVRALVPLVANAERRTSYAVPSRLESAGLPEEVAFALAAAVLAAGLVLLVRAAARGRARLALSACLLLVTTPYLAVWYLAWPVALAAVEEDDRTARIVTLALCAYLLPQTIPL